MGFADTKMRSRTAAARAAVYSDDEYDEVRRSDRRTKPKRGGQQETHYNQENDPEAEKAFWRSAQEKQD